MPPQPQPPQPQGSLPCAEGQPLMPGEGHDLPTAPEAQWETVLSPQDRGARGERTVLGSSKAVAVALAQMVNKTLQQHNEAAKSMAPTGQWTFHKRKKDVGRLPADELLGELEKRGLTLDRNADAWSGTGEKGNNDKLKLLPHEGEEVVLDKQKLAEKLVRYDCGYHQGDTSAEKGEFVPGQACWGRFIGFGQQCGTPVGRLSEHEHKRCRTAQHYCETCLKSLCVPADRVHVVARKDAQAREGCYANGNQPVWTVSAGGQKFRSFNTHAPCKHEDISIVVWKEAPTADAESRAPAPQPIPPDWLHGEEGAKYVSLSYKGGSRDFEPTLIPQEEDPQEAGEAGGDPQEVGSARQPTPRKRRWNSSQAAGTSQDPGRRSSRVQELQDANAAAREAMFKAYDAFIAAARALHGDPAAQMSDWAKRTSATSELEKTFYQQMRERVESSTFRSLGCDEAHEDGPEGGAVYCNLGAEAQEGAPPCSLSGGGEDCGGEDSAPSKDGMLEALVESLAALDMVRVPPQLQQLQQLQDEFRELYRNVFSE